jgi:hypothetical protein
MHKAHLQRRAHTTAVATTDGSDPGANIYTNIHQRCLDTSFFLYTSTDSTKMNCPAKSHSECLQIRLLNIEQAISQIQEDILSLERQIKSICKIKSGCGFHDQFLTEIVRESLPLVYIPLKSPTESEQEAWHASNSAVDAWTAYRSARPLLSP